MSWIMILMIVLAGICLLFGLLLSGSGSTTGLTAIAGQDLELFKKTKDRGFVKILQILMFILMFIMIALAVLFKLLGYTG